MSRSTASQIRRGLLAALATSAAVVGLVVAASPAQADTVVQATGPAAPVPVNTPYTVTVNVPADGAAGVSFPLTGSAATVTSAQASTSDWACDLAYGQCWHLAGWATPTTITLTITPTASGTVTTTVNALDWTLETIIGSDTVTTEITNPTPTLPFTGFFAPVRNAPEVNAVNAGRSVPMKFSLDGDKGLNILADGSPTSRQTACDGQSSDPIATGTATNSGLTYDPASSTYTYVWQTDKAWAGTCRTFDLTLIDGTDHTAVFQFS